MRLVPGDQSDPALNIGSVQLVGDFYTKELFPVSFPSPW